MRLVQVLSVGEGDQRGLEEGPAAAQTPSSLADR